MHFFRFNSVRSCVRLACFALFFALVSGCSERQVLAPVVELKWRQANKYDKQHTVLRGETLYAIAFRYDRDYRQLALANHLRAPFTLRVGQVLTLQVRAARVVYRPHPQPAYHQASRQRPVSRSVVSFPKHQSGWLWPAEGRVVTRFVPQQGKKGIDIAGHKGQKIRAAGDGTVAYAGNGLAGYGNLIIIKHDNQYLTAYGNNFRNLVNEGQRIHSGQTIADMGIVDRRFWGVHFEMRRAGQPVNPIDYLKK